MNPVREHMAERELLSHNTPAPHLAAYAPSGSEAQHLDLLTHLHQTLNTPSHLIRNRPHRRQPRPPRRYQTGRPRMNDSRDGVKPRSQRALYTAKTLKSLRVTKSK